MVVGRSEEKKSAMHPILTYAINGIHLTKTHFTAQVSINPFTHYCQMVSLKNANLLIRNSYTQRYIPLAQPPGAIVGFSILTKDLRIWNFLVPLSGISWFFNN